jgi:hypothetical protein
MAILDLFTRRNSVAPLPLPMGGYTVDGAGRIVASTLPHTFPRERAEHLARLVLDTFRDARKAEMPVKQFSATFTAFKITARVLRDGAMIFVAPRVNGDH